MKRMRLSILAWLVLPAVLLAQGQSIVNIPTALPDQRVSTKYITTAATTNATLVKAGPGVPYGFSLVNCSATVIYLRMYNLVAAPTCSSATGFVETIPIPASTACAGVQRYQGLGQADYTTGIAFCATGGGGSTDNTAAVTGGYITILYK